MPGCWREDGKEEEDLSRSFAAEITVHDLMHVRKYRRADGEAGFCGAAASGSIDSAHGRFEHDARNRRKGWARR